MHRAPLSDSVNDSPLWEAARTLRFEKLDGVKGASLDWNGESPEAFFRPAPVSPHQ